jgi:hypothetical protein
MYFNSVSAPVQSTLKCLQLLHKILDNIAQDPFNEKFHSLFISNKTIKEKVLEFEGVVAFLLLCGFVEFYDNQNAFAGY